MAQPRPMSTPIFDELLREFVGRLEEQRGAPPEQTEPPQAPPVPQPSAPQPAAQGQPVTHRHRAE
jgi:hypothetical protein